jgi:hypothetical protein
MWLGFARFGLDSASLTAWSEVTAALPVTVCSIASDAVGRTPYSILRMQYCTFPLVKIRVSHSVPTVCRWLGPSRLNTSDFIVPQSQILATNRRECRPSRNCAIDSSRSGSWEDPEVRRCSHPRSTSCARNTPLTSGEEYRTTPSLSFGGW